MAGTLLRMRARCVLAGATLCLAQFMTGCGNDRNRHDHALFERDLLDSLQAGSMAARIAAARGFTEIQPSQAAVGLLRHALADSSALVRVTAARVLARWPVHRREPHELLAVLGGALAGSDPEVRAEAAQGLGSLGAAARGLLPRLERAAHDSNAYVRDEARTAIRAIRRNPEG